MSSLCPQRPVMMYCYIYISLSCQTSGVQVLVVNSKGIGLHDMVTGEHSDLMADNEMLLKEVDYHYARGEVYALTKRQILVCPLSKNSSHEYRPVVYSEDEFNFMSMAVDWVHDVLYWTGGAVFMIHKAALNGSDHRVIFRGYYIENYHKKMAVDPHAGLLIWASTSQIFATDLNGKNLHEIQFPEVLGSVKSRVKNFALDVTRRRIYFLAGFEEDDVWLMMSGNYDGSGFRRHDPVSRFTYALAAMGDDLYWIAKEMGPTTYSPRGFRQMHTLVLYKGSTEVLGVAQRVMDLYTGAVWNMKLCDQNLQRPADNTSSSS